MITDRDLFATDAFSFDRYGTLNWTRCIKALRRETFTDEDIETILRSKWTRWAADAGSKRYGAATAKDLVNFVRRSAPDELASLLIEGRL